MSTTSMQDVVVLEQALAHLKRSFERFFMGLERRPPEQERQDFRRKLRHLTDASIVNTSLKFRVTNLQSSFTTHDSLWERQLAEREKTSERRDLPVTPQKKPLPPSSSSISTSAAAGSGELSPIDKLYAAFAGQFERAQLGAPPTRAAFEAELSEQYREAKARFGQAPVTTQVTLVEGRPSVRVVLKKT